MEPEYQALQETLRRFVDRELIPFESQLNSDGRLPPALFEDVRNRAKAAGIWMPDVPDDLGGAGLDLRGMIIFWEEISRTVAVPARDHSIFGPTPGPTVLRLQGDLARRYRDPVLRGDKVGCFAQTEPDAGADPRGLRTRAIRDGDHYIVNGTKRFITHADRADFAQVMVRVPDANGKDRITCLLVDMDLPGVRIGARHRTMMGDAPCEIVFEDARVPVANRVGDEGAGFALAQDWINEGRLRHAARACGVIRRCIDDLAAYAKQRRTFGAPLADRQALQWTLADAEIAYHSIRLMARDAAVRLDTGKEARFQTYIVKAHGDEMGFRIVDRCLQFYGGLGLTLDMPIQKFWRDQRSFMITEGPIEVMRMAIAREVLARAA